MTALVLGGRGGFSEACDCIMCNSRRSKVKCLVGQVVKIRELQY